MVKVTLAQPCDYYGVVERTSDFDFAVSMMDDDIRESVHMDLAPCTEQEFIDEYCKRHEKKFEQFFVVG